jgi:hypothetical protein
MQLKSAFTLGLCLALLQASAQQNPLPAPIKGADENARFRADEIRRVVNLQFTYDYQVPSRDMADRFGSNSAIGFGSFFKDKKNFFYGIEGAFMFGSNVKENGILDSLRNSDFRIIGINGGYSNITLSQRGYFFLAKGGKIIPLFKRNRNSGIMISGGVGFMQHKIRIAVPDNNVPLLDKEYRKGYDRLTNGLVLNEFIGFYYLDRKKFINFYVGYNLMQGFTQSRRDWNYDTRTQDTQKRIDQLGGIRFGWIIPIYPAAKTDEYIFY